MAMSLLSEMQEAVPGWDPWHTVVEVMNDGGEIDKGRTKPW